MCLNSTRKMVSSSSFFVVQVWSLTFHHHHHHHHHIIINNNADHQARCLMALNEKLPALSFTLSGSAVSLDARNHSFLNKPCTHESSRIVVQKQTPQTTQTTHKLEALTSSSAAVRLLADVATARADLDAFASDYLDSLVHFDGKHQVLVVVVVVVVVVFRVDWFCCVVRWFVCFQLRAALHYC